MIDWAAQVVAAHPADNVIISTHAYLDGTGARPTTAPYGDLSAEQEWQQLISRYPNIKIVLSDQ